MELPRHGVRQRFVYPLQLDTPAHLPIQTRASTDFDAWTRWLREAGVSYEAIDGLQHGPDHDGPLIPDRGAVASFRVPDQRRIIEHRNADAVLAADHATRLVARCLERSVRVRGRRVLDLGCGTGTLSVMLHRLGARSVVGSDIQREAIELARRTAAANDARAEFIVSDLLRGVSRPATPTDGFDLIVGTLPHKPFGDVPREHLPIAQAGGHDGTELIRAMLADVREYLAPGGELVFFLHSLPDVSLLRDVSRMGVLRLHAWRRRVIQDGEYTPLMPLFHARNDAGASMLRPYGSRNAMMCGVWGLQFN